MITNKERLKILLQPFVTTRDLMLLIDKAKSTASKTMAEIHRDIMKKGIKTIRGYASTKAVMEYLSIDLNEVIENARIENELNLNKEEY